MRKYSYESMLRAVGRVLDEAEVAGFAIREDAEGLVVETRERTGAAGATLTLGLKDLVELIDWASSDETEPPRYERSYAHDEGTLRAVLQNGELVGAGR
ncbi:MAG: hypothetical protein ACHQ4H_01045 [Ktedonobacterales bacterium]